MEKRVQLVSVQPSGGALVLALVSIRVPALVLRLVVKQSDQEVDVLHSQPQNFILAELLVGWVRGNEFPQLGKSSVHVLLAPALAAVGKDAASYFLRWACRTNMYTECRSTWGS